ncbi:MAG: ABC transporter ATP-binding protein [Haliea sp.]|nr:ABC transporter ATP-binding protein [Haliea sp.]|tara:strand:- start:177370 stop:179151 length:1782 start_codon:yes stop_codon:yes gene_type:complete
MKPGRSLSPLLSVFRFLLPYRARLLGALVALLFTAGATLALGQGVQLLIDQGLAGGTPGDLRRAIGFIMAIAAAMAVGTFLRFYLVSWLGERVSADLRQAVFDNVIHLHTAYFEDNRSGEIMSRLTTDTSLLQTIIGSSLSMALRSSLTLSGGLVMMFVTNPRLSLIIAGTVPLVLLPILIFGRRVRRLSSQSQASIADVGSRAGEIIQQLPTVQAFTAEAAESRAFGLAVERAFQVARRRIRQRALLVCLAILLLFSGMAAMLWSGGSDVLSGRMSPGELGAFTFYAMLVGMGFATIAEVWGELQRAAGAAERLLELLNTRSALPDGECGEAPANAGLRLQGVTFSYPSRADKPALRDLELEVPEGQSLALVGPSGAGKSTLFQLLQRFYDPDQGQVLLGSVDLRTLRLATLRGQLAIVPQQPVLFTASVHDNIAYGRPDASREQVEAAARAAHAHDFIQRLPQGYDSHLGELGVRLSGGQRQRIALARAILRNPRILLLDEATSALDSESEHHVQEALREVMRGRTTLVIAHRLATIQHVDRIAVLEEGRVIATGTHQSLLRDCPLYARLAELQFRDGAGTPVAGNDSKAG